MNASNLQSKRQEEGCGKWLTKRGKTSVQLQFKPCVNMIIKPIITEPPGTKKCKMQQTKISKFLVGSTIRKTRKVKKHENNSYDRLSTFKASVVLRMKRRQSSEPRDDEDLWGSDRGENDECETADNIQATQRNKQNIMLESDIQLHEDTECLKMNDICGDEEQREIKSKKLFPSPKRVKMSKDSMDADYGKGAIINSPRNEVQFTEWFENEIDAFIEQRDEKKYVLNKDCSLPSFHPSDSEEESTSIPQFSEWFSQQVHKVDHKEVPRNVLQSRTTDVPQHNSIFTHMV